MKVRDTLLGLLVVGLLVAGMVWTRARSHQGGSGGPSGPVQPAADAVAEAAIPDVTLADGVVGLGELRVVLSVAPRPPVAFQKKQFRVRTESHGRPVVLEGSRISFEMVMPMAPAGLHVTWKNTQADCEEIEGERKTATAEYAIVFSVPGSADNKHDGSATDKVEYTYRLRCKKSGSYSPYSNEMSGTP